MKSAKNIHTSIAFYSQEQYPILLEMADDADVLEKKWEDWYKNYFLLKQKMEKEGIVLHEILVDVFEWN